MITFTEDQQKEHRETFVRDCHQKAWGARCHADWISKQMDELMAQYQKMGDDHRALLAEIKTLETALDSHTKDNREKRKELQGRATNLAKAMEAIGQNANQAQQAMAQLHANAEQNLALAAHAEGWSWNKVATRSPTI